MFEDLLSGYTNIYVCKLNIVVSRWAVMSDDAGMFYKNCEHFQYLLGEVLAIDFRNGTSQTGYFFINKDKRKGKNPVRSTREFNPFPLRNLQVRSADRSNNLIRIQNLTIICTCRLCV
jgi:hypothetical protein